MLTSHKRHDLNSGHCLQLMEISVRVQEALDQTKGKNFKGV